MEALETFLNKYSSKFPKGYPDINNIEDNYIGGTNVHTSKCKGSYQNIKEGFTNIKKKYKIIKYRSISHIQNLYFKFCN